MVHRDVYNVCMNDITVNERTTMYTMTRMINAFIPDTTNDAGPLDTYEIHVMFIDGDLAFHAFINDEGELEYDDSYALNVKPDKTVHDIDIAHHHVTR